MPSLLDAGLGDAGAGSLDDHHCISYSACERFMDPTVVVATDRAPCPYIGTTSTEFIFDYDSSSSGEFFFFQMNSIVLEDSFL